MKTLYFDCFAGASGDMILGALVSVGVEPRALVEQLSLLNVSGYEIDFETVDRSDIKGELVTPTGAAIISTVCREYGPLPKMKIERTGYGAGTREYQNFPNVLRLMLGDDGVVSEGFDDESLLVAEDERLLVVETN